VTDVVIRVDGLGKRYRLGARKRSNYSTLRESLVDLARLPGKLLSRTNVAEDENTFWALRNVSFEVSRGDVLGVVGRNGAGKSTLLKVLSRIVEPTEGEATIVGRVGSLLEVGTGFHPELTGRENIFLNGAILGMRRAEILAKFDEIVAFAEVERFIDTPVKHYSSGMGLKLGFAVAAHLEPEILVVDEVLAVGDAAFQKKCLGKMGDVARQGRTVLFVSHNMAAAKSLCTRGLVLDAGQVVLTGDIQQAVDHYLGANIGGISERVWLDDKTAPGDERARLRAARTLNGEGRAVEQVSLSEPMMLEVEYEVWDAELPLNISVTVHSHDGILVFVTTNVTDQDFYAKPHLPGRYRSRVTIPGHFFNEGRYAFTVVLTERARKSVAVAHQAVAIDVVDLGENRGGYFGAWHGVVRPLLQWRTASEQQPDFAPRAVSG
jgi:lipopolysaccharide transport system ATP-binding protein